MDILKSTLTAVILSASTVSFAAQTIPDEKFFPLNPETEAKEIAGKYNIEFQGKNHIGHIDQYGLQMGYPFQIYKIEKNGAETKLYVSNSGQELRRANPDDSCQIQNYYEYNGYCFKIVKVISKPNNRFDFIDNDSILTATRIQ